MNKWLGIFLVFVAAGVLFTVFVSKCDHTPSYVAPVEQPIDSIITDEPAPVDSTPAVVDSLFDAPPDSVPPFDPKFPRGKKK